MWCCWVPGGGSNPADETQVQTWPAKFGETRNAVAQRIDGIAKNRNVRLANLAKKGVNL